MTRIRGPILRALGGDPVHDRRRSDRLHDGRPDGPLRPAVEAAVGVRPRRQSRSSSRAFGKRKTFREVIEPGAFTRRSRRAPDIVLHYQHDERTLPLGRTKAGTLA
jgi:hypothetical protein